MRLRQLASKTFAVCIGLSLATLSAACSSKTSGSGSGDDEGEGGSGSSGSGGSGSSGSGSGGSGSSGSASSGSASTGTVTTSGSSTTGSTSGGTTGDAGVTIVTCGQDQCNLSTNTCCVGLDTQTLQPTGRCIAHNAACMSEEAAFNCGGAVDCAKGQVCCGTADKTTLQAQTFCQSSCPTTSSSDGTTGQSQVCRDSAECLNKMECIPQTCVSGFAHLDLCGLQTQQPYGCMAAQ